MTKLLTLKHWQLFALVIGIPVVFQITAMASVFTNRNPIPFLIGFPIIMIVVVVSFFGWLYALGTSMHTQLPPTAPMNLKRFKIFFFIPFGYIVLVLVGILALFSQSLSGGEPPLAIFALVFPVHLFSMFCIFYCLYFNAKALKTVEWQRPVTFSDFAGEFFLMWFFPIGIWFIQPRINALVAKPVANHNPETPDEQP